MSESDGGTAAAAEVALDRMADGFVAVDREWRVTFVNERVSELLGRDNMPERGTSLWDAYPGLEDSPFGEAYHRALDTGEQQTVEAYYDHLDGWFRATVYPDDDGLSIYFQDVTQRRRLEENLRRENELRERVFETTPTGVVVLDADGVFRRANERATELLGLSPFDLGTVAFDDSRWEAFDGAGEPLSEYPVERVLETGEPVEEFEHGFTRPDGERRWLSVSAAPLHDSDGNVDRIVLVVDDHTAKRRLESRLRDNEATLRRVYEVAGDPELSFEEKLQELLSAASERLDVEIGFLTRIESDTQTFVETVGDYDPIQPGETCPLSEAYCRRTVESDGLLTVRDAESQGWAGTPPHDVFGLGSYVGGKVIVDGELYGTLCFADETPREEAFSDTEVTLVELLTQWVSYELGRRRSRERVERKNERLDEFASVLSHDLRNPLNVAAARVEMASETGDTDHLADAAGALDRMDELIDDVLSLARHGERVVDAEPVPVGDAAERAWAGVGGSDDPDATLRLRDPPTVRGDESRIVQLFEKLLGNATDHAGPAPTVTVGRLDDDDGFYVEDDGPGVPTDHRDDVFDRGFSTDDDGTGFGLGIVEEIADAHDWTVRVADVDDGARFEVLAPVVEPFDG